MTLSTTPAAAAPSGATETAARRPSPFKDWLLHGRPREVEGPHEQAGQHERQPWWKVMCLTGVDYFSTLGYQPGIAALAAGALAPAATLILVLITLFGALPMYKRVAGESPHGDGSISMLERLLPWWQGKLFVLCLIGFVATGFVITITLSAADATAHIVKNPYLDFTKGHNILVTLILIALLGAVFLKGFGEAIGIAVWLVVIYLVLNLVVIIAGAADIAANPQVVGNWRRALWNEQANPLLMIGAALLLFPKLALGLSGFETGVVVMPLVKGDPGDTPVNPAGRIRNTRRLLTAAAGIMSVMLLSSSLVTIMLIPEAAFDEGGEANGRALAYLAYDLLGNTFGALYDVSTILILWFAGASALAGLLNIVPRYLPRYGMAPDWARATRPLTLIFIAICFIVTLWFRASVDAQAGAYATGVLAVMTSATIAVTLSAARRGQRRAATMFGVVAAIFVYTTLVNVVERPEGLQIALFFIAFIVIASIISRVKRSTELRVTGIEVDDTAQRLIDQARAGDIRLIAHVPDVRTVEEYDRQERARREDNHIPDDDPVMFLEVTVSDASEFAPKMVVRGEEVGPHCVLRIESASVANAIAAFLLYLRDTTGKIPHAYFDWSEGNPLKFLARFILYGQGDTAPLTREILRQAEPDPARRPGIHVG